MGHPTCRPRGAPFVACLILAAQSVTAQDTSPVGGVGREACATLVGPENISNLAQAADWGLGYLAGRVDAGQAIADGAALSTRDSVDVVTGLVSRCRMTPEAPIIDAMRDYALEVFGEEAQGGTVEAAPIPPAPEPPPPPERPRAESAPPPRPEGLQTAAAGPEPD